MGRQSERYFMTGGQGVGRNYVHFSGQIPNFEFFISFISKCRMSLHIIQRFFINVTPSHVIFNPFHVCSIQLSTMQLWSG